MPCPPEITEILTAILTTGLLRIRAWCWGDDPARCTLEADHLHNLPGLLANYKLELLDYYWQVERPCFIERSSPEDIAAFEPLWQALEKHVTPDKSRALAG
jgi:hypothetical protein